MSTGVSNNVATVTASAAQLTTGGSKSLAIYADSANAGSVYVGGSGVTTANGFPLAPGDSVSIDIADAGAVYIIGTANDHVRWLEGGVSV